MFIQFTPGAVLQILEVILVGVPPTADEASACDKVHATVAKLKSEHLDVFGAITGDFNHVRLDTILLTFHQFVDWTKWENTGSIVCKYCPYPRGM